MLFSQIAPPFAALMDDLNGSAWMPIEMKVFSPPFKDIHNVSPVGEWLGQSLQQH